MEKSTGIAPRITDYIAQHRDPEEALLAELRAETQLLGGVSRMQVSASQGLLLGMLVQAVGATQVLEVGTFTGYSSFCMARRLPEDGRLYCFDVSEQYTSVARRYWQKAGLDERIELILGPAVDSLAALSEEEWVDFAFIDADKGNYWNYVQLILPRLRRGGLIAVDNVLWSGAVAEPEEVGETVVGIRDFNRRVLEDERIESLIVAVGDGLNLLQKR